MPPKKKEEERDETAHFVFPDGSFYNGAYAAKREAVNADGSGGTAAKRSSGPTSGAPKGTVSISATATAAGTVDSQPTTTVVRTQHGHGTHTDSSGAVYSGQWRNGSMTGDGSFRSPTGSTYTGAFHEGLYHGVGKYTWPDGSSYEGSWVEGKMHGNGVYVDMCGRRWYGKFSEGSAQQLVPEVML